MKTLSCALITLMFICYIHWTEAITTSTTAAPGAGSSAASSAACVDKATNCGQLAYLCKHRTYTVILTEQCAKTCGICSNCQDSRTSCPIWKNNGFCQSEYYTEDQKRQFCANSCDLCATATTAAAG